MNKTVVLNGTLCAIFPSEYCPSVDAVSEYGVQQVGSGCELSSWLVPEGCLLPVPFPVAVELGRWERQSQNLTANAESQQGFEGGLGCRVDP